MLRASRIGILLLVVLLAGCTTLPNTDTEADMPQIELIDVDGETTADLLSNESNLDDTERPHNLTIQNTGEAEEELYVNVTRDDTDEPVFEQLYVVEPNETVTGVLDYKANYTIVVESGNDSEVVTISRDSFDCNYSGTTVSASDGDLDAQTFSTLMGCPEDIEVPEVIQNDTEVTYLSDESNLGERENPHGLTVRNTNSDTDATVVVRITRDSETVFEQTYHLASETELHGVLDYKANYSVTVTEGDREATEDLPYTTFDCNSSNTTFTVSDEELEAQTISTMAYCPPEPPE